MKFRCTCDHLIVDSTDFLPHKAHTIADRNWFTILDAIDEAIEESGPSAKEKEAACMHIRTLMVKMSTLSYQCRNCGMLYLNDHNNTSHCFQPLTDDESKEVFKGF